jgi:hypothetical protein
MEARAGVTAHPDPARPGRRGRAGTHPASAGRWLGALVLLITVGVVGMHQLSDGHALITPDTDRGHHGALSLATAEAPAAADDDPQSVDALSGSGGPMHAVLDCGDCSWHTLIAMCLLALLLVHALRPRPRPRSSRPMTVARSPRATLPRCRPRPAPTLAQLCVSRT